MRDPVFLTMLISFTVHAGSGRRCSVAAFLVGLCFKFQPTHSNRGPPLQRHVELDYTADTVASVRTYVRHACFRNTIFGHWVSRVINVTEAA